MKQNSLIHSVLTLADNNLILGHRLSEWCGHGPVLEQDIALSNIALDLIGQARLYYQYAAELRGEGATEDDLAYLRSEREYVNVLLVERPNQDFGYTLCRQFLYDSWHYFFLRELMKSGDERLAQIAEKSIKEVGYHRRFTSEWVMRLGDGTEESHKRVQAALDELWKYSSELFEPVDQEREVIEIGLWPHPDAYVDELKDFRKETFQQATLEIPETRYFQMGGKKGKHTEFLGHILSQLQYMQRAYPNLQW